MLRESAFRVFIKETTEESVNPRGAVKIHSSVEKSLHRKTISHALHRFGLCGRVGRGKLLVKENHSKSCLEFARSHVRTKQACGRRDCGHMRADSDFFPLVLNVMCGKSRHCRSP